VDHGHSLDIVDLNSDGHLDIFNAEMRLNDENDDAKMWVFLGNSAGNFITTVIASGYGNHESRVADLDGDGDLDILGKPYNWQTPRVDIWLQNGTNNAQLSQWQRHVVDDSKPWRSVFITAADIDGDAHNDIITGGWWYKNPGTPDGTWTRSAIGSPLNNMAAVYDFDGDGAPDVLGTGWQDTGDNDTFAWAHNDGAGNFTIFNNIEAGDGDFLQGVAIADFADTGRPEVALSWHAGGKGVQVLDVPADPLNQTWPWAQLSSVSQDEGLSVGDIDRDNDPDLLLGTKWLRNDSDGWSEHTLSENSGDPDRNRLADINGDGKLDAVIGYESASEPEELAWYEQGDDATELWTEHVIATIIAPMSVDVADMDGDGDIDVVAGEHNKANPDNAALYVFENVDGTGTEWATYIVHVGDEHHDGARLTDIDNDGDMDIISIGWDHDNVLLYENRAPSSGLRIWVPLITAGGAAPADNQQQSTGLQALYTFAEGSGSVVHDVSGVGAPLDLTIADSEHVSWGDSSLTINSATRIMSSGSASKLITSAQDSNALTLEAWVQPANTTQDGPARIVTISQDANTRNLTLGQGRWGDQPTTTYDVRLRTTERNENGRPSLTTPTGTVSSDLSHVVYTRDSSGTAHIYVDGQQVASGNVDGSLRNWDSNYRLALGNEIQDSRPWLGTLHLVAIYNRALSSSEVRQHFAAGPEDNRTLETMNVSTSTIAGETSLSEHLQSFLMRYIRYDSPAESRFQKPALATE
jgi:hypothetical protein